MALTPYWRGWVELAIRRLKEEADFQADLVTSHLRPEAVVPEDETSLLQVEEGRPGPNAWLALLQRSTVWPLRVCGERPDRVLPETAARLSYLYGDQVDGVLDRDPSRVAAIENLPWVVDDRELCTVREDKVDTDVETSCLMQVTGSRMSHSVRAAQPHRPREWLRALGPRLEGLAPATASRVRALLRQWLTMRINRIAGSTVVVGIMIRDVLHECTLLPPVESVEVEAQRIAEEIQQDIEAYLGRVHRSEQFATQPWLLHQALVMAVRVDEMDLDRLPMVDQDQQQREHEEVHLMFRANQLVRQHLPREGSERARRIQVIMESVRSQIGAEARHLRRLAVGLPGLQMLGGADGTFESRDQDSEWLPGIVDELLLLAGQEDLTSPTSRNGPVTL